MALRRRLVRREGRDYRSEGPPIQPTAAVAALAAWPQSTDASQSPRPEPITKSRNLPTACNEKAARSTNT